MGDEQALEDARAAYERGAWSAACTQLACLDARAPLDPEDLERLAAAAYLIGEDGASDDARTHAHTKYLERGDVIGAARSAFWLGFALSERPGQQAQAAGWLARAERLLDGVEGPCVERGFLLCSSARQCAAKGDVASAHARFAEAAEIASRFGDRDLLALARHGEARALLGMRATAEGLRLIDEVMVAVTGGEIQPIVAGVVYCSVISACHSLFDLGRAQEWTSALQGWCESHPDLVPFRGYCLIRRSELMQFHGNWRDAVSEAQRACDRLTRTPRPEAGAAYYQLAELHRLRGELGQAEEAYRLASQAGCQPQPGLALLRMSQGQTEAAAASIRLALKEARDPRARVLLLGAGVEILLAAGDVEGARAASDELVHLAGRLEAPYLRALSSQAAGALAFAEGQALPALERLRAAAASWQELDAPYELARSRVLAGLACRQLGDEEGARLELEAAQDAFETLGAATDVARVTALTSPPPRPTSTGLTGREIEVLRLVATGATNRAIAGKLGISEKTVARHVSNIFAKLDLSSRTAATAFAYDHKLL